MTIKKIYILPLMLATIMGLVLVFKQAQALTPSDTYYGHQWYLKRVEAFQAWDKVKQTNNIVVAVIDSGVDINHPDLKNNIWINPKEIAGNNLDDDHNGYIDDINGWDFVNSVPDPSPKFDFGFTENGITHGTLVAGIIAGQGNNNEGIAGISWHTKIMPLKVLTDSGQGSTFKIIKAIDYAVDNKADIINLSFVGFDYNKSLESAVKRAYDAGVIIVAAGGNEEGEGFGNFLDKNPMYPVCHDGNKTENRVIGVAATGPLDQKASFSGYGGCIDIAAPGISIFGASVYAPDKSKIFNKYYDGYWSGTSLAVPIVSGTISLIKQANPKLSSAEVREVLLTTADNINLINPQFINRLGVGRVNVSSAVEIAQAKLNANSFGILTSVASKEESGSKLMSSDGKELNEIISLAGYNLASGDLNNNKQAEIIAVPKKGFPVIQIFNKDGELINKFTAGENLTGASLAVGDTNHDGNDEIIVGLGLGSKPEVKIFNKDGQLLASWLAYAPEFSGGVNVAVGDTDQDGIAEIITAPMSVGGAHIRIFNHDGRVLGQFFAYHKKMRSGFQVAVGNVFFNTRQQGANIIVVPNAGMSPYVRVFSRFGDLKRKFAVYPTSFTGGVELAVADTDHDGLDEIITGAGPGGSTEIKIFKGSGLMIGSFSASEEEVAQGVSLSAILLK
ncbi:MAG: S8 family serine peptidase [bacterium]